MAAEHALAPCPQRDLSEDGTDVAASAACWQRGVVPADCCPALPSNHTYFSFVSSPRRLLSWARSHRCSGQRRSWRRGWRLGCGTTLQVDLVAAGLCPVLPRAGPSWLAGASELLCSCPRNLPSAAFRALSACQPIPLQCLNRPVRIGTACRGAAHRPRRQAGVAV